MEKAKIIFGDIRFKHIEYLDLYIPDHEIPGHKWKTKEVGFRLKCWFPIPIDPQYKFYTKENPQINTLIDFSITLAQNIDKANTHIMGKLEDLVNRLRILEH